MKFRNIYLLLLITLILAGCGNDPVFTEMSSNRLKIIIKGTFETESSSNFTAFPGPNNVSVEDSNSVDNLKAPSEEEAPTTVMIDIAEIRVDGKKISNFRHVLEIPLDDNQPFFNGTGIEIETDDPGSRGYGSVQLYIRKIIFDKAKVYQLSGSSFIYDKEAEVIFNEETRTGFDFNQLMVNSYWDSLREESDNIVRVFPLQIPIVGGMSYSGINDETVLEIRLLLKNFIKKYEYDFYENGVFKVCHYYAPSDWLRDVRAGETDIGRNLHAVARAYVTGKTGSITVNSSAGYVVAIPASENISEYGISGSSSNAGVLLRDAVGASDLPLAPSYPGAYIEPLLDYYLKFEEYKTDWNNQVTGLTLDAYEAAWDTYEIAVKGDPSGLYPFGLKIPPYAAYSSGTSVTFTNMAPGTYMFYYLPRPSYGSLFLNSDFAPLNGGMPVNIGEGINTGF